MARWNPFKRSLNTGERMIRVQVEKRDGEVSQELYRVNRAVVERGWLKLYQAYPVHKRMIRDGEEQGIEVEFRTRDLWINKDFIVSIEDPYHPMDSDIDLQKILQENSQEEEDL